MSINSAYGLDSPGHLSRLLTAYGAAGMKKQQGRVPVMREAVTKSEGLVLDHSDKDVDQQIIGKMCTLGWDGVTSSEQRSSQTTPSTTRFYDALRPLQTKLRSKRAKRCRSCRHNLLRPDDRRMSTRFKIRLLAINYICRVSLRPLKPDNTSHSQLKPLVPTHFLITFRNPLFDDMKITLATPPTTSGKSPARVTILCPQFEVGATKDVWDEALESGDKDRRRTRDISSAAEGQQPEAGKVWEKGRNWTTIVLEVIPTKSADETAGARIAREALEVAISLRMEYEADDTTADPYASSTTSSKAGGEEKKIKKELSYWVILGLGRVGQLSAPLRK
ncbi:MAG: hypothetical protein M1828_002119 [Chrysothrix sp. TS-e1954]|nr:MAG: hypothetical protein M1828_002119 [Chrysothrix sp. TS-e1954]